MNQLNLYSDKTCDYCGNNPGSKPDNYNLWRGFYDGDTNQHVCLDCKPHHYNTKQQEMGKTDPEALTKRKMTYTEFPVMAMG